MLLTLLHQVFKLKIYLLLCEYDLCHPENSYVEVLNHSASECLGKWDCYQCS